MDPWSYGSVLNYKPLLRQSFLESSLVVSTMKSNFSNERCGVLSKWLLAVSIFIEKPFCCFWLIGVFFCAQENDLAMTFSALLLFLGFLFVCLFFSGETTYYTSWIAYFNDEQLFQKNVLTGEHAVSFWREPTEGSLLPRLGFSIFYTKPKCVYKWLCAVPIHDLAFKKEMNELGACISNLFFHQIHLNIHFKVQKYRYLHHGWLTNMKQFFIFIWQSLNMHYFNFFGTI